MSVKLNGVQKWPYSAREAQTPFEKVTTYNNFYEFGMDKEDPRRIQRFRDFPVERFR